MRRATREGGDVAARVAVRFDEMFESLRLIRATVRGPGRHRGSRVRVQPALPAGPGFGAGWVEGWRGEVFVALELDGDAAARASAAATATTRRGRTGRCSSTR